MKHANMGKGPGAPVRAPVEDEYDVLAHAILAHLGARRPAPEAPFPDGAPAEGLTESFEVERPAHVLADHDHWPWLPTPDHGHLAQHPYCEGCGGVRYLGSLRPLKMGALVNLATRLADRVRADGRKVTEAQFRLIMKQLTTDHADDTFVVSRPMQERILVASFSRCTGLDAATVQSYLRAL